MMIIYLDNFLNRITMYRLALYGLFVISILAVAFGFAGLLPYSGFSLLISLIIFNVSCHAWSVILAKLFGAPASAESSPITSLILFLIFAPAASLAGAATILIASAIAMLSKYLIVLHRKHLFNPAAFAAVALGFGVTTAATWWVGSSVLFPFVLVLGLLIVRKTRRFDTFLPFLVTGLATILAFGLKNGLEPGVLLTQALVSWPVIFFGTVMLTEPQTMPGTRPHRIIFGVLVGLIFGSQFHIGPVYPTPEVALLVGNAYAFAVNYKRKLVLKLKDKTEIAKGLYDMSFIPDARPAFAPGQYMEWTIDPEWSDGRGNRRYFTIASSPTEQEVRLGVKLPLANPSKFKQGLVALKPGETLAASQVAGDFLLPKDRDEKMVFIAGGIGITPFRSMLKYLIDTKDKRDIVLFYAALSPDEFAYKDIFKEAEIIGLKTVYVVTDEKNVPSGWTGRQGFLSPQMVKEEISDWSKRTFYLSGPQAMVVNYRKMLRSMGVPLSRIRTDYFPGF